MILNHTCPRCKCQGLTASWGRRNCLLCSFTDSTGTTPDEETDKDILLDLYSIPHPLVFMRKDNVLSSLNFGLGNLVRK